MTPHDTFLRLAATAVDEHLTSPDRARLEQHLTGCWSCARAAAGYRADATAIAALQPPMLSERRGAEILAAVLAPPSRGLRPVRLVLAVALLLLALAGSLWAGSELLNRRNDDLAVVLPVPSASAVASPQVTTSPPPADDVLPAPLVVTVARQDGDGGSTDWVAILEPDGRLTPLAEGSQGAWLDETTVVFACGPDICRVDVTNPATVQTVAQDGLRPVPAPDGSMIAFHRGMIDVPETWLVRTGGSTESAWRLADGDFGRWSPDGQWLVGQLPDATSHTVSTVEVGRLDALGYDSVPGYDPAWSPSGTRIVYTLVEGDGPSVRMLTPASGEVSVLYTAGFDLAIGGPVWVNEAAIVFVQDGDLYRLDVGASTPVRLTSIGTVDVSGYAQGLEVSPDGRWIAYTSTLEGSSVVEVVSVDGSTTVTFPVDLVSAPRWGPIGAAVPAPEEASASPEPTLAPVEVTPKPGSTGSPGDVEGYQWAEAVVPDNAGRPTGALEAVSVGAGGFVAVGRGCAGDEEAGLTCEAVVWVTGNGGTWSRAPVQAALDVGGYVPTSGPEVGMFDVVGGADGVVAIGYVHTGRALQPTAWYSPDGMTWQRTALAIDDRYRVMAVTWDGQRYVAVGEDRTEWDGTLEGMPSAVVRAAAWTSTDGVAWTRAPAASSLAVGTLIDTMEDPSSGGMADVVEAPGGLVAVGSACDGPARSCEPAAWLSQDGLTWERLGGLPAGGGRLSAVATVGGELPVVAVGAWSCADGEQLPGGGCPALVVVSGDLRSWTRESSFPQGGDLRTITWVGDRLLATAPDGPQTVWASRDGVSWEAADLAGGPDTSSDGGDIAEWQFAATPGTAVWVGVPMASDRAGAWVSPAR